MIDLEHYKKALGSKVDELTESQILELRDKHDQMAELFFTMWLGEIKPEKV
jgi:hypothetical protein